ncbi:hypothetical protein SAMN05660242_1238 [Thermoanaerobacterium sp. RBIITD]|nr:hypothetical protein SAMN05660242_1238 [Thermoanaerobacterium sp. RBIITD]
MICGSPPSPTIGYDGTIYVGSNDNYLYAIGNSTESNAGSNTGNSTKITASTKTVVFKIVSDVMVINGASPKMDVPA